MSGLFLGAWYYFKPFMQDQTKTTLEAAIDFKNALSERKSLKDSTVLFLVNEIKDKHLEKSTRLPEENIRDYMQSLHRFSVEKFGEDKKILTYLEEFKKGLDSFRPRYEKKFDVLFNRKSYLNPDKAKFYESVQESLKYMGGYWGLVDTLDVLIKAEKQTERDFLKQKISDDQRKIKLLEDSIKEAKEKQAAITKIKEQQGS